MAYVITQNCCKDASCVSVCPVDCIRPNGEERGTDGSQMLYIDPETCVDCGACEVACPVGAIYYEDDLPADMDRYRDINSDYFIRYPLVATPAVGSKKRDGIHTGGLRVAVVGTGPAACYVIGELVDIEGVEVDVYERLATPFGLVRSGVAPDHHRTKSIVEMFGRAIANPRVHCYFNVEVGTDLTHDELMAHHHAVVYGTGASKSRSLGIPGERLLGSYAAGEFVNWYNGHPDYAGATFDLVGERAVIIGNGNVALDIARVLLTDSERIRESDMAPLALAAVAESNITEVVIIGRRGLRDAAFSAAEFLALGRIPGVDVVIQDGGFDGCPGESYESVLKYNLGAEYSSRTNVNQEKRIVFRFMTAPIEFVGNERVEGLLVTSRDEAHATELIETSVVFSSIGYTGSPVLGLPFDQAQGSIPNVQGRVCGARSEALSGVYVAGWIKRGTKGVIGTNRACAEETVSTLWEDHIEGQLTREVCGRDGIEMLLHQRNVERVDWRGWLAIDAAERRGGEAAARPRVKVTDTAEMLTIARQ